MEPRRRVNAEQALQVEAANNTIKAAEALFTQYPERVEPYVDDDGTTWRTLATQSYTGDLIDVAQTVEPESDEPKLVIRFTESATAKVTDNRVQDGKLTSTIIFEPSSPNDPQATFHDIAEAGILNAELSELSGQSGLPLPSTGAMSLADAVRYSWPTELSADQEHRATSRLLRQKIAEKLAATDKFGESFTVNASAHTNNERMAEQWLSLAGSYASGSGGPDKQFSMVLMRRTAKGSPLAVLHNGNYSPAPANGQLPAEAEVFDTAMYLRMVESRAMLGAAAMIEVATLNVKEDEFDDLVESMKGVLADTRDSQPLLLSTGNARYVSPVDRSNIPERAEQMVGAEELAAYMRLVEQAVPERWPYED